MESLRIYVTAEEKETITRIAKQKNISVTQLVKDTCINLLNPSAQIKQGTIVSVRGTGRFIYEGIEKETRRGRLRVLVRKY